MSITSPANTPPFPIVTSAQRSVLAVAFASAFVPVVAVVLRIVARRYTARTFDASDGCIIIACMFAVALQGTIIVGVFDCGIGYGHILDIVLAYGMAPITKLLKLLIPFQLCWVLSLGFTKASILLLYHSIFPYRVFHWTCRGAILFKALWVSATILIGGLICRPFAMNWNPTIPGGHCGNYVLAFTITGIINLVTDVVVLVLPLPYLYKLHLRTYKKVVLLGVFSLGLLTCIVSAIRIEALWSLNFFDITYASERADIVSALEPSVGVTLACVPLLQPLLRQVKVWPERSAPHALNILREDIERLAAGNKQPFESLSDNSFGPRLQSNGSEHHAEIQSADRTISGGRVSRALESEQRDGGITVDSPVPVDVAP